MPPALPALASLAIASPPDVLDPRPYQRELFERARLHNTLAVMDTGSGKTLIACMLLKHALVRKPPAAARRLAVFLVDKVPLALQQGTVVPASPANCCRLRLEAQRHPQHRGVLRGKGRRVVPRPVEARLRHKRPARHDRRHPQKPPALRLCKNRPGPPALPIPPPLALDKSPHLRRFYFETPLDKRPRIFGMTASPFDDLQQSIHGNSAENLEKILDAHICTVTNMASLKDFLHKPVEIERDYQTYHAPDFSPLHKTLDEMCKTFPKSFKKAQNAARAVHEELGPWCAHHAWGILLNELKDWPYQARIRGLVNDDVTIHTSQNIARELAQRALEFYNDYNFAELSVADVSPKVNVLLDILREVYIVRDVTAILFVDRRATAFALNGLVKDLGQRQLTGPFHNIKSEILVGHGTSSAPGDVQMDLKNQQRVLCRFRNRSLNLLIATSVGEEGLDIISCSVVIRFDLCATPIQYIQSRGRARQHDSKFYLIKEAGNASHVRLINQVKVAETTLREYCARLPSERKIMLDADDDGDPPSQTNFVYIENSTGARLTEFNALGLLNVYCQSLPLDKYTPTTPTFTLEGDFMYSVTLPKVSPLKEIIRGSPQNSRKAAKRVAGFLACVRLREIGELDEYLRPPCIRKSIIDLELQELEKEVQWTAKLEYPVYRPACWLLENIKDTSAFYINIISLEKPLQQVEFRNLCFLSRTELSEIPDIDLFDGEKTGVARISTSSRRILLDSTQSLRCRDFTLGMFATVLGRQFVIKDKSGSLPFFIVPLCKQHPCDIDWELLEKCLCTSDSPLPESLDGDMQDVMQDVMVSVMGQYRGKYTISRIRYDLGPSSIPPPGSTEEGYKSIAEYYEKHAQNCQIEDICQPLLEARKVSRVLNYLHPNGRPRDRPKNDPGKPFHLIPEMCLASHIPASLIRAWLLIPAIYMRLEAYLLTRQLGVKLKSNVSLNLLLTSLQSPSANMSTNYERLEFIGDTFLKFVATLLVYTKHPEKHEGFLHLFRKKIICNQSLYYKAIDLGLPGYVCSFPFSRGIISLPGCFITGHSVVETQRLGKKTVADVMEALLGAAYLHGQLDEALKMSKELGIVDTQISHIHEFFSEITPVPQHSINSHQEWPQREQIEQTIGYKFRDGNLLRQALTHASVQNSTSDCYQRLEFAGDAVLDLLAVDHICRKFPSETPANLTLLKNVLVSNKTLCAICIDSGFQLYMEFMSSTIISDINIYVESLESCRDESNLPEYWMDLHSPKFLSDVVESLIGAIFFDSGCRMDAPLLFFQKFHLPFCDPDTIPTFHGNPMTELMQILQKRCENYHMQAFPFLQILTIREKIHVQDENALDQFPPDNIQNALGEFPRDYIQVSLVVHDTIIHSEKSISLREGKNLLATHVLEQFAANDQYCFQYCDCKRIQTDKSHSDDDDDFVNNI
ncbi:Dicer-like protein 1 [Neolecta irregularis DAH-3]|uniref:Dicer-like protein 1 n=1 Tax=Neolecta irregularis (strain DAH-3) TaxID=1198029 RepID=A0A1U7LKJ2_NEOID|nr:Dicer-like protein 1 [Neolecta irregularis DAH-3]|eukprot:OLL23041.1 Dicer-like protein 1 [Neolecta irregularis DAH-3]